MKAQITFEEYSHSDREDVLDMMAAFNQIDGYPFDREVTAENLDQFSSDRSLGKLFLIKHLQNNIGYIALTFGFSFEYRGRDEFIDEFFIQEDYRHQGIGKQTMEFLEIEAKKLGVKAIHLEVEGHNKNAQNLYLQSGFIGNDRTLLTKRIH